MKPYTGNDPSVIGRPLVTDNRSDVGYPSLRLELKNGEQLVYMFYAGSIPFAFIIENQNDFSELERRYNINEITRVGIFAV